MDSFVSKGVMTGMSKKAKANFLAEEKQGFFFCFFLFSENRSHSYSLVYIDEN